MSGETYFVHASTLGIGNIPVLPNDLRREIYERTFPKISARCSRCKRVVLLNSLHNTLFQVRPYTLVHYSYCCLECIHYKRSNEAREGD